MAETPEDRAPTGGDDPVVWERLSVGDGARTVAVVRLNRPDSLNPIDTSVLAALDAALDEIAFDPQVATVLVTGNGRAFSAGGDLKGYQELQQDPVAFPRFVADLHRVFGRFRQLPVPTVALVNGVAVAGGLELILNCDFALVAESARIGDGHLNFGQMGGGGVLTLLPRAIGRARAAELVFSGRLLTAPECVEWGLASRVVPDADLLDEGLAFATEVAAKSPLAVANAKAVMHDLWADNGSVDAGLRYELERDVYYCLTSHDAPEGLAAFREKRTPRFEGR
ncbi:enoyl-CoA hydratase/isomerase family protein [Rhabdothermincola salaria]|uniref:enoyl-CoA hydratase/isomerase family protein n=1 Tax=Rhabdothermincola salaria TaxID=2903142 RepID=UPI001E4A082E|nr:enoyl-CoA hydratase/isomerase family protein [Rhabdothermincola salaria]MCD9623795.1 enoyl-CoA hydratase/isomerase family protein [Rhabdothermincola salaria]